MSLPPISPPRTTSGIAVDPKTLDRVVPESRRPDGSIRKEIKIRPGFTPQEDVTRFRGTRQVQMDRNTLPKGHILGWVAPSSAGKPKSDDGTVSKSAKKNEKRKEKRDKQKEDAIRANWEDDAPVVKRDKKQDAIRANVQDDTLVVKDPDPAPKLVVPSEIQAKKSDAKQDSKAEESEDLGRRLEKLDIR